MNTRKSAYLLFALALVWLVASTPDTPAYPPVLILGLYGQGLYASEAGADPYSEAGLRASGVFSWRTALANGASLALHASSILDRSVVGSNSLYDAENFILQLLVPRDSSSILFDGGLSASGLGTLSGDQAHLRPDWNLSLRHRLEGKTTLVFLSLRGYYLYQPDGEEDALYQGAALGFEASPGIRLRYGLTLEGGWEGWLESPLFAPSGDPLDEKRRDFPITLSASAEGLLGYFFDWKLEAETGLRLSNANRFLETSGLLEEGSERLVFLGGGGRWGWSPRRNVALEMEMFARQDFYLERDALTEAGFLSGQPLRVFSTGAQLHGDWTPDDRLFLAGDISAARRFANEEGENRWTFIVRAGVEYSF
jgi:hypothetical protein